MVARVEKRIGLSIALLAGLSGCKDDAEPFLPLPQLCARLAEDVCGTRELCGCEQSRDDCDRSERAACTPLRDAFEAEDGLRYDSVLAERTRSDQLVVMQESCTAALPLGHYFQGTLEDGADCERDTQCTSTYCDPDMQVCASPDPVELCPAP